mgnify:CR=1 FL=1
MLEQVTAFRPFVRESVVLPEIAWSATYHDVANIVRSSTRQRNNVFNVILPFRNFNFAIITTTFLTLILLSNITCCMLAWGITFTRTSILTSGFKDFLPMFRFIIAFLTSTHVSIMFCSIYTPKFRIFITSLISSCNFYVVQPVYAMPLIKIFSGFLIGWTPGLFASAFFALAVKPIRRTAMRMEVLFCKRQILFTSGASLEAFWRFMVTYVVTRFTSPAQTIFSILGRKEKLAGCRKGLLAFKTSLQYNIIHRKGHSFLSRLRLLE